MAYPRHLLNDEEEIIIDHHPHWAFMLNSVVMVTLSVLIAIAIAIVAFPFSWLGVILIVLSLFGSAGQYIRWKCVDFVVTTDRVVVRQGVLSKSGMEIPLDRITNIAYNQSLIERILGTGNLMIESAGESGRQLFTHVISPSHVQNVIYKAVDDFRDSHLEAIHGGGHHGDSIPDQIEKLDALRQRGILSEAEFAAKKRELLDRL